MSWIACLWLSRPMRGDHRDFRVTWIFARSILGLRFRRSVVDNPQVQTLALRRQNANRKMNLTSVKRSADGRQNVELLSAIPCRTFNAMCSIPQATNACHERWKHRQPFGCREMNRNLSPARQGITPNFRLYCATIPLIPNGYHGTCADKRRRSCVGVRAAWNESAFIMITAISICHITY